MENDILLGFDWRYKFHSSYRLEPKMTEFHGRPLAPTPTNSDLPKPPRPSREQLLLQFVVLCGNDNFSTWFYQELMGGRNPL